MRAFHLHRCRTRGCRARVFVRACGLLAVAAVCHVHWANAQTPVFEPKLPKIATTGAEGKRRVLGQDGVWGVEVQLFQRFQLAEPLDEIFAFQEEAVGWGPEQLVEVIVHGTKAELRLSRHGDHLRYYRRALTSDEIGRLHKFVADNHVDRLPCYDSGAWDGVAYAYWHFNKDGACRLTIANPDDEPDEEEKKNSTSRVYNRLVELFERLADPDKLEVRYLIARQVPDMEVLFARVEQPIQTVWAQGDDVRVLVETDFRREWRRLAGGKIGARAERPAAFPAAAYPDRTGTSRCDLDPAHYGMYAFDDLALPWQTQRGEKYVRGGRRLLDPHTWIVERGKKPEKLFDGLIQYQVVTPDGRWLVGTVDRKLICFDLTQRKMLPTVEPEEVDGFYALRYVPAHREVLLIRPPAQGPFEPKRLPVGYGPRPSDFRLLDPATGRTTEIEHVEEGPWRQKMHRPFQPVRGQPGVVWAACGCRRYDDAGVAWAHTSVGRYDTETFRFLATTQIDSLVFGSDDLWVDEAARKIYVAYKGHVLRLPLPPYLMKTWRPAGPAENPLGASNDR